MQCYNFEGNDYCKSAVLLIGIHNYIIANPNPTTATTLPTSFHLALIALAAAMTFGVDKTLIAGPPFFPPELPFPYVAAPFAEILSCWS